MEEGEELGKRQKRREEEVKGKDGKDRQEEPQKAFMVLLLITGSQRGCKEPIRDTTSSSSAKPCTPLEMQLDL